MTRLQQLRQQLEQLRSESATFLQGIEAESRSMTTEEQTRVGDLATRLNALETEIRSEEQADSLRRRVIVEGNRVNGNTGPNGDEEVRSLGAQLLEQRSVNISSEVFSRAGELYTTGQGAGSVRTNISLMAGVIPSFLEDVLPSGNVIYTRSRESIQVYGAPKVHELAENASLKGQTNTDFVTAVNANPNRLGCVVPVSEALLRTSDSAVLMAIVMEQVRRAAMVKIEEKIFGKSTTGIKGIFGAGYGVATATAAAATPTGAELANMRDQLAAKVGRLTPATRYLFNPATVSALRTSAKGSGLNTEIIGVDDKVFGANYISTNMVKAEHGAGTKLAAAIVTFEDLMVYFFGDIRLDLERDPDTDQTLIYANLYADAVMAQKFAQTLVFA